MGRPRRYSILAVALVFACVGTASARLAPAAGAARGVRAHRAEIAALDSMLDARASLAAEARFGADLALARARGDASLRLALRLWRARTLSASGDLVPGQALYDSVSLEVLRSGDPVALDSLVAGLRTFRPLYRLDKSAAPETLEALRRAALHGRSADVRWRASFRLGQWESRRGDLKRALTHLRGASAALPVDAPQQRWCDVETGLALLLLGRADEARPVLHRGIGRAERAHDRNIVARILEMLASLEYNEHDPAAAVGFIARAHTLAVQDGDSLLAMQLAINECLVRYTVEPSPENIAPMLALVATCERAAVPKDLVNLHSSLANAYLDQGEWDAAIRHATRCRAVSTDAPDSYRSMALNTLASVWMRTGFPERAVDVLDTLLAPAAGERREDERVLALIERAEALRLAGRGAEAELSARDAERASRPDAPTHGSNWQIAGATLARILRERGRVDSALALVHRLEADWEKRRALVSAADWESGHSPSAPTLFRELGLGLLDARRGGSEARRTREAFDALQVYQARTLEERMQGSGSSRVAMARRITLDSLQRFVLRPGELLLDLVATPDTTLAFAVTRNQVRVRLLPGLRELEPRVRRVNGLLAGGRTAAAAAPALDWFSDQLLAPFSDLLGANARVVVCGGGALALLPWAALPDSAGTPMLERHETVVAPSATIWALERRRAGRARGMARWLVLGRTTDAGGRTLSGVREECAFVARVTRAERRVNDGRRDLGALTAGLERFTAIHVASHTYSDNSNPWRSGVLLGRGRGDDAYLRASDVARRPLAANLVVLSGCRSAAARALPGEGPQGLGSAFLCAGTPTVVATLWDVHDEAAAEFASRFHRALEQGLSVAAAHRAAQRAMRAEGREPRDWAAFAVWGAGETAFASPHGAAN